VAPASTYLRIKRLSADGNLVHPGTALTTATPAERDIYAAGLNGVALTTARRPVTCW
jgi:hypothetical protein